ncbi:MAG: hypothetical protein ACLR3C_06985 [Eggerthella lenta]
MASNALIAYKRQRRRHEPCARQGQGVLSGDKDKVSDREVTNFMMLCKAHRLNPFTRELT